MKKMGHVQTGTDMKVLWFYSSASEKGQGGIESNFLVIYNQAEERRGESRSLTL